MKEDDLKREMTYQATRATLDGVLWVLGLSEAYENGHDVIMAADLMAQDMAKMADALEKVQGDLDRIVGVVECARRIVITHADTYDFLEPLRTAFDRMSKGDGWPPRSTTPEGASVSQPFGACRPESPEAQDWEEDRQRGRLDE